MEWKNPAELKLQGYGLCGDDQAAIFFIYSNLVLSILTLEEFK